MTYVELVIKIPKEYYEAIMEIPAEQSTADMLIIKNGTPHESVTEFADRCRECGREKVLDKIRAEIESQREEVSKKHSINNILQAYYFGLNDGLKDARDIIDEYKSESDIYKETESDVNWIDNFVRKYPFLIG